MDMAGGHEEMDRAASHVKGGFDSERYCYQTLRSEEKVVVVEKDDADWENLVERQQHNHDYHNHYHTHTVL